MMCSISTRSPTIRTSQSSASTRCPSRWWPRNVRPCLKSLDFLSATTTSTSARVCSTSSRSSSPSEDGDTWTSATYGTYGGGFAEELRRLVEEHYPEAEKVRV